MVVKEYVIGDIAKIAHVSVRTLHHYDKIGLLKPSSRALSGYRFYTDLDLETLHDILFYRALGFSLKRISEVLNEDGQQRIPLLQEQKKLLDEHISRLENMRTQLTETLLTEENKMDTKSKYDALGGFDPDQYEGEVKERWGESDAYKESSKRTKKYSKDDWARYKAEADALNEKMIGVMNAGENADSVSAIKVVEEMRLQIDAWFYPCSRQMHAQLGEMYIQDPRFMETYETMQEGMAKFMQSATAANFEKHHER
jgi:DNA-binding transcriptional MerR regulator